MVVNVQEEIHTFSFSVLLLFDLVIGELSNDSLQESGGMWETWWENFWLVFVKQTLLLTKFKTEINFNGLVFILFYLDNSWYTMWLTLVIYNIDQSQFPSGQWPSKCWVWVTDGLASVHHNQCWYILTRSVPLVSDVDQQYQNISAHFRTQF